jgi:hypothetical protein
MAKKISAATVSVDLVARSSSFSEVLDRAQRQSATSSSAIIKSLGKLESFSKTFENKMNGYLFAPFKAFKTAIAPFTIGAKQVINTVGNMLRPFKNLAVYVSGPFVKAFNQAKKTISSLAGPLKWLTGGVLAAVTGFTALVIGYSKAALETDRLSKMLGVTYKELNQLSFVAMGAGVEVEALADALKDLSAKATDASFAGGGPLEPFFKSINQSKDAWDKFSPIEQLEKFAGALDGLSYNEVLYWADEVGGAMAEMAPLLAGGAAQIRELRKESELFGGAFDNVDGLKKLQGVFQRISFSAKNIFSGIGNALAPTLTSMFENAMTAFQEKMKGLSPDGNVGQGFVVFANQIAGSILIGTGKLLNGIQSMVDVIKSAFYTVIDFLNKANDVSILKGEGTAETNASSTALYNANKSRSDANNLNKSIYDSRSKADAFKAANQTTTKELIKSSDGRSGGMASVTKWNSPEVEAEYNKLQAEIKEQAILSKSITRVTDKELKLLTEKHNRNVELANAKFDAEKGLVDPNKERLGDSMIKSGTETYDNAGNQKVKTESREDKAKRLASEQNAAKKDSINSKFSNQVTGAGIDFNGTEGAITLYNDKMKELLKTAITTDQQIAQVTIESSQTRVLIQAGAERDIALAKSKITAESTEQQRQATDDEIAEIQRKADYAIDVINTQSATEINNLNIKKQQQQDIETKFHSTLRDLDIQLGFAQATSIDIRAQAMANERQLVTEAYDNHLAELADKYGIENEMYQEMIDKKKEALDGLLEKQTQAAIDKTEQEVADNENSLARTLSYLDEDYNEKVNAQVGITELRENDISEISDSKERVAEIMAATGQSETQVKAEQEAKQKAGTIKLGADLLGEAAKTNRKAFEMNKAMNIANATISMFTGAAKALEWGWPLGPVFAGLVVASGLMNISSIKAQKFQGKAHKGQTTIDGTGDQSWILQGGERVVSKEQNVDLKNYLKSANTTSNNSKTNQAYITNNINGSELDDDALLAALARQPAQLRKILQNL